MKYVCAFRTFVGTWQVESMISPGTMQKGVIDQRQGKITGEGVKENGLPMELRSICNE